jgi:hypothetical protein
MISVSVSVVGLGMKIVTMGGGFDEKGCRSGCGVATLGLVFGGSARVSSTPSIAFSPPDAAVDSPAAAVTRAVAIVAGAGGATEERISRAVLDNDTGRSNAAFEMGERTLALRSTSGTRADANPKRPACRESVGDRYSKG